MIGFSIINTCQQMIHIGSWKDIYFQKFLTDLKYFILSSKVHIYYEKATKIWLKSPQSLFDTTKSQYFYSFKASYNALYEAPQMFCFDYMRCKTKRLRSLVRGIVWDFESIEILGFSDFK